MSVIDVLRGALGAVRKDAANISTTLQALRAERETLLAERETLTSLPMARADLETHLHRLIDEIGSDYPRRLAAASAGMTRRATRLEFGLQDFTGGIPIIHPTHGPAQVATPSDVQTGLCFLLAPLLRDGISRALDQFDFSAAGAPAAQRVARIDEIDTAIHRLDQQEAEIMSLLTDIRTAAEPSL